MLKPGCLTPPQWLDMFQSGTRASCQGMFFLGILPGDVVSDDMLENHPGYFESTLHYIIIISGLLVVGNGSEKQMYHHGICLTPVEWVM